MRDLDAVILAGGMGTRLRAVVSDRPKVLAEVNGRPFITYLLDQLEAGGIRSVVISTGYMADLLDETLGATYGSMQLRYSRELEPLGTGGGVRLAFDHVRSDPLLVINGDSFCAVDLPAFFQFHTAKSARASLVVTRVPDTHRYGRVEVSSDGAVLDFKEKGGERSAGWINAGLYLLSRDLLAGIPEGRASSIERDLFQRCVGAGLYAFAGGGAFLDIGTPESYAEAERFFMNGIPSATQPLPQPATA